MRVLPAVLLIGLILVNSVGSQQKADEPRMTSQTSDSDLIVLNVTVIDKSDQLAIGLNKSAFTIYDNDVPQAITFAENKDVPLSVGIIYDMSGSMAPLRADERKAREALKLGLAKFIQSSNSSNEYFLIGFNKNVKLLSDWTSCAVRSMRRRGSRHARRRSAPRGRTFHSPSPSSFIPPESTAACSGPARRRPSRAPGEAARRRRVG